MFNSQFTSDNIHAMCVCVCVCDLLGFQLGLNTNCPNAIINDHFLIIFNSNQMNHLDLNSMHARNKIKFHFKGNEIKLHFKGNGGEMVGHKKKREMILLRD